MQAMRQHFWPFIAYLIGLLFTLTLGILALIPLHRDQTYHISLPPVSADGTFSVEVPNEVDLSNSQRVPIYRFHQGFRTELGFASVKSAGHGEAVFSLDSSSLLFPHGRQGFVSEQNGPELVVCLGKNHGFKVRDRLNVFGTGSELGENVGKIEIVEESAPCARAKIISLKNKLESSDFNLLHYPVGEYTVQTFLVVFSQSFWLNFFEAMVLILLVCAESYLFIKHRIGLLAFCGKYLVSLWMCQNFRMKRFLKFAGILLFSIPFAAFWGLVTVYSIQHIFSPFLKSRNWELELKVLSCGIFFVAYLLIFTFKRRFPALFIWEKLRFKPSYIADKIGEKPIRMMAVIWSLHLLIAYAFAFALIGFLSSNINTIVEYLLPNNEPIRIVHADLTQPWSIMLWCSVTWTNIMTLMKCGPASLSLDQVFTVFRLSLWSITIIGCLLGYVHSIIKIPPWVSIKNIDFTVMGWMTNAFCYGPLLGVAIWQIAPEPEGLLPVISEGPIFYAMVVTEFLLNVLYTASIWNMFTKFGVMVDKGLVDFGFFKIMRHPNYTLESFMFLAMSLRGMTHFTNVLGVSFYFLTYWLRSEREEVFMERSNEQYTAYKKRVRYKYFPGLV